MTEIAHASTGESLRRFIDNGWEILQNPLGGGHNDVRCTGGWWLYKGDEAQARAEQEQRWHKLRSHIDSFWANNWN